LSRSGDFAGAESNRVTSDDEVDPVKVLLQGEGEGVPDPTERTPLEEVLEGEDAAALSRFLAVFPEAKEEAS
jgi:hypothetical protein